MEEYPEPHKGKKVLVTGGAGTIRSNLVRDAQRTADLNRQT
jgi:FlaA1/EpsC-like NDP-sugar epimerase